SRWQVAAKLGGFLPGGGPGSAEATAVAVDDEATGEAKVNRSNVTGPLPVDCMLCHRNRGSGYSPFVWTEQIESENFAYAPTAALGIATVSGTMTRLKDDFDPQAADSSKSLPKVTYEPTRFRSDGKVFFDVVRKPDSNACYYCHTNSDADAVSGSRWLHDEDIHLRAGMVCADCHRNALSHETVRGFEGETHAAAASIASFSCQGCHMPNHNAKPQSSPGRLGAPEPEHRGLPPLHFDKLSCTACHSGSLPEATVGRQINSIAHRLGDHGVKRTGNEQPGIVGPVVIPAAQWHAGEGAVEDDEHTQDVAAAKLTPHRMMWPSFWGIVDSGKVQPLNPEAVYELVRRPLKVRREFTEELAEVKLSLSVRKELLGEERSRAKDEDRTDEEKQKIAAAESEARKAQVGERIAESLASIEKEYPDKQAVYISGGMGFVRDGESAIKPLPAEQLGSAADPYAWPMAHSVRPARQALGAEGCTQCHNTDALIFKAQVQPVGLLPDQETVAVPVHDLQQVDIERLAVWSSLFQGRSSFKIAGLIALGLTCLVTLSAFAVNLSSAWRRG
ncbi:MAG: hypothetical protein KDB22_29870, partial [Planctomycetales bacterium]|nr:hypothetical protein [Planctomycetales bacterium]